MSEEPNVNVEELRSEIDQIKAAMGIQERYSSATTIWLLFGLAVPIAAALSQYVHLERLPTWYHSVIWPLVLLGGLAIYWLRSGSTEIPESQPGKPSLWVQFLVVYLAAIPLQSIAGAYTSEPGYVPESAVALSIILVMLGVAYGVFGSSLAAYHIRQRDRYVFYAGTVWMIALAVAIPGTPTLERWAYAAFGGLYFVYALAAYLFLKAGGETAE